MQTHVVATDVLRLAKINSSVHRLRKEYEVAKRALEQYQERAEGLKAAGFSPPRTIITTDPDGTASPISTRLTDTPRAARVRNGTQEPTPPSNASQPSHEEDEEDVEMEIDESDTDIVTGEEQDKERHDSAASLSSLNGFHQHSTDPTTHTPHPLPAKPKPSHAHLDASTNQLSFDPKNRGGQRLRWSLPENLVDDGRAEAHINFSRMAGESKSARRRRVKREMQIARSWGIRKPDTSIAAGGDEEEEL